MYRRNNKGPRMVPCGVPEVTRDQTEQDPLTTTRCFRPTRKCLSQSSREPSMPLLFNFKSSRSWGTLSKALARSRKMTSVGMDKFRDCAQSLKVDNNWVTVDLPLKKPNWLLLIRSISRQNLIILSRTIFSPISIRSLFVSPTMRHKRLYPGGGGYSIYSRVGRCGPALHTLTLFKTNIADFPTLFKTEIQFLIPCLRHLTRIKSCGYKLCGFLVV